MPSSALVAYTGLWKYYFRPSEYQFVLTLGNPQALALLAFLSALVAYTQTRMWIVVRSTLLRFLQPLYLKDDKNAFSLSNLSQLAAVRCLLRKRHQSNSSMVTVSPWFGICCIINTTCFAVLGALVPYCLTGSGGVALVQSTPLTNPVNPSDLPYHTQDSSDLASVVYMQCWFNISGVNPACSPMTQMSTFRPQLSITREIPCPFPEDLCVSGFDPIRIQHDRLLLRDFGMNSNLNIAFSRRVTCAPLETDRFILTAKDTNDWHQNGSIIWFGKNLRPDDPVTDSWGTFGRSLATQNTPYKARDNMYENKASPAMLYNPDPVVDYFPSGIVSEEELSRGRWEFHPDLQRNDGNVLVVMLRAGLSMYPFQITDPLYKTTAWPWNFTTNTLPKLVMLGWSPEREATAVGCVEQFKVCLGHSDSSDLCTVWNKLKVDQIRKLMPLVLSTYKLNSKMEEPLFHWLSTLYRNLSIREIFWWTRSSLKLLPTSIERKDLVKWWSVDPKEQWTKEVSGWFEISFLRMRALNMGQSVVPLSSLQMKSNLDQTFDPENQDKKIVMDNYVDLLCPAGICRGKLFLDGNHTNIGFTGLMITISTLIVLCAFSYIQDRNSVVHDIRKHVGSVYGRYRDLQTEFARAMYARFKGFCARSQAKRRTDSWPEELGGTLTGRLQQQVPRDNRLAPTVWLDDVARPLE